MATVVTDVGMGIITNRIKGSGTEPNYLAWGTGTNTAAAADTALQTASAEARVAGTSSREETNVANDTYRVVGTLTSAGNQTIAEAGLFDASTTGNCFVRGDFSGVALAQDESIEFTVDVVFDQE